VGLTNTFDQFTDQLATAMKTAQHMGMSQQDIVANAERVGDWLAQEVSPQSPEQRLLKEMWNASNNQEQQTIAGVLVKMVQQHH